MIALSKTLDPADFEELTPELSIVDRWFTREREQHPMRRWEYALALRALTTWRFVSHRTEQIIYDIGGAGSPFQWMLPGPIAQVIDPDSDLRQGNGERLPLDQFVRTNPKLADMVFCLSVIEHVDNLDQFLYHLSCLVAPGGLLFLTMDACGCSIPHGGEDSHHFHWMRKRIFTIGELHQTVAEPLLDYGFNVFGARDLVTWAGPHVYDYTFASLALRKRA